MNICGFRNDRQNLQLLLSKNDSTEVIMFLTVTCTKSLLKYFNNNHDFKQ